VLKQVVEAVGDDNIVVSTDYPHSRSLPHAIEDFVPWKVSARKTKARSSGNNCARCTACRREVS